MAKLQIVAGATSQTVNVFIQNSASAVGAGLTGLVFNTSGLTAYYALPRAASASIALVTLAAVTTAWTSGGFKEVDATNMPGVYRLDLPNAVLASGRFAIVYLQGAANMAPCVLELELTAGDNQVAPYAGADTAGTSTLLGRIPGTVQPQTGDAYARLGAPAGASVSADIATRSSYAGGDTSGTTTLLSRIPGTVQPQTGDAYARLGAPAGASVAADVAAVKTDSGGLRTDYTTARAGKLDNLDAAVSGIAAAVWGVATRTLSAFGFTVATTSDANVTAIKAKTDTLPAAPAAVTDIPTATQNADALLGRDMAVVAGAAARSPLNALRFLRNKWSVAAGTLTVCREDDSTVAWTGAVVTDGSAQPVTGSDPA